MHTQGHKLDLSSEGTIGAYDMFLFKVLILSHPLILTYLLSKSFGWFLLSRFLSMRSDRSCLRTPVAYSISPCRAVMIRDATLPRSRMEKDLWASSVRMKVNRKCFLVSSWPNNVRAFSTLAGTWRTEIRGWWGGRRVRRWKLNKGRKRRNLLNTT